MAEGAQTLALLVQASEEQDAQATGHLQSLFEPFVEAS